MKKIQPWILTLISGFAVYLFDKLIGPRIPWDKINKVPLLDWLAVPIPIKVYHVILFIPLFFLFYYIYIKVFRNDKSFYTKKQVQLQKFNKSEMGGILWKWDVEFDSSDKPFISGLTPYCLNHGDPPLKMSPTGFLGSVGDYVCPMHGCTSGVSTNAYQANSIQKANQVIESHIEQEWEKIQKK